MALHNYIYIKHKEDELAKRIARDHDPRPVCIQPSDLDSHPMEIEYEEDSDVECSGESSCSHCKAYVPTQQELDQEQEQEHTLTRENLHNHSHSHTHHSHKHKHKHNHNHKNKQNNNDETNNDIYNDNNTRPVSQNGNKPAIVEYRASVSEIVKEEQLKNNGLPKMVMKDGKMRRLKSRLSNSKRESFNDNLKSKKSN